MALSQSSWLRIRSSMLQRGDAAGAEKIAELAAKLQAGKASIAFSGHFSAGKSSLINMLCGRKLLPTGPIPTSANLVVIENGQEEALVYSEDGAGAEPVSSQALRVPIEQLSDYCRNGQTYRRIEIRYPSELLSQELSLMDTPGVDSTDDAHRVATESSLHLADAVFYITDYNHVLSEMNLSFTKRLKDWGKPLYVIVNQVDKHRESELSYEAYRANVKESFHAWGIRPDGFLFVSVKDIDHPNSDWSKLLWLIGQLKQRAGALLAHSASLSARVVIHNHIDAVFADASPAEGDADAARRQIDGWDAEIRGLEEQAGRIREQFRAELTKLIDNAPIMSAATRDLAVRYLQSRKPGFKVGLWFAEAKTKAEIAARLDQFHAQLRDAVEKQLIWHIQQLMRQYAERCGQATIHLAAIEAGLSADLLAAEVKESAGGAEAYAMTYCRQIAEHIKAACRRRALDGFEPVLAAVGQAASKQADGVRQVRRAAAAELDGLLEQERLRREKQAYTVELFAWLEASDGEADAVWPNPDDAPSTGGGTGRAAPEAGLPAASAAGHPAQAATAVIADAASASAAPAAGTAVATGARAAAGQPGSRPAFQYAAVMAGTAHKLERAAELLAPVRTLAPVRLALLEKAEKLRGNRFTVALFGAFSAGKSSLTNALIGEPVLPVSPNPTTAAINSILPPTAGHAHRTAQIRMKSQEALLGDVRHSLSMLGLAGEQIARVEDAADVMKPLRADQVPAKGKPHLSFLKAVEVGYAAVRDKLGTAWTADFDTYRRYVAEEEKSCFVESIDLYYETRFGSQGVIFVDTPGADSIHARHTGVTFNYIKNADAILFVTYYNHAFSQADKQFLLQLGRVKDAFDLDKMFFLVNAADLAASQEELDEVLAYVEHQLLGHGIRHPRLFAVSSRLALEAKQSNAGEAIARSGIDAFEQRFSRFAEQELADATVRSARADIGRTADRLRRMIAGLREGDEQRRHRAAQLGEACRHLAGELRSGATAVRLEPVAQELTELLHHVKQRCYYRFGELYNDAFHPAVLQEDGRNMAIALQSAWKQLQQTAAIDASQEPLATTLRMEQFIRAKVRQWNEYAAGLIAERLPEFIAHEWQEPPFATPPVGESLGPLATDERTIRKLFRNAKFFFEGEGKPSLKLLLERDMAEAVGRFVDEHHQRLAGEYERLMAESIRASAERYITHLEQDAERIFQETAENYDIADLQSRLTSIQAYIYNGFK